MRLRPVRLAVVLGLLLAQPGLAWNNGRSGDPNTDTAAECGNPPHARPNSIAEQALVPLPQAEREWLNALQPGRAEAVRDECRRSKRQP
jgi:hypothetical protein